jgi:polysaccharide transporter, PST family
MFLFRAVQSLAGSVNRLVLGGFAPVAALGEYAGAERITRVFQQGMWPVNQALYPKLSKQVETNPWRAMKTVRLSLLLLGGLGLIFGLMIFLAAPFLVRWVLGPQYVASIPVLRVFALWIPLIALTTVVIFQLLLPNHLDNQFNFVNFTGVLVAIVAAILLAPRMGAVGIAWSAVAAQTYTLVALVVVLLRTGLNPFAPPSRSRGRLRKRRVQLAPALVPANGSRPQELRLRERLAEAEAREAASSGVVIPITPPVAPQLTHKTHLPQSG